MLEENCPVCGLPKDLCVCSEIEQGESIVEISTEKRKFGKVYTIIEGLEGKKEDLKSLFKALKQKLGCGGALKDKSIELQGNHVNEIKKTLIKEGFDEDLIRITYGKKK